MRKYFYLLLSFVFLFSACQDDPASAPGIQVGIVIVTATDQVKTYFLTVPGDAPTALDALTASGVEMITLQSDLGTAVCSILGTGQPADTCFSDPNGNFWAFFAEDAQGAWKAADVGVEAYAVKDGDVLGFTWTGSDANFNPLITPPVMTLDEIASK